MSRIILKSNDSLNYYPNNKPSDFNVKTINLSTLGHHLEVALTEIIFPSGFKNVRNGYNQVSIIPVKDEGEELTIDEITEMPAIAFTIDPNFYTPPALIEEINSKIHDSLMKLELEEINNQSWIRLNKKICIKFGLDIAKILGFNFGEWSTFGPEKKIIPNRSGPYKSMSLLNVYCNIVEESLIGENHHQLLRLVNCPYTVKNDFTFNPSIRFERPYFIPVKRIDTNCIEIKITDSLNLPIEFLGDEPLVVILEFRNVGYKGL